MDCTLPGLGESGDLLDLNLVGVVGPDGRQNLTRRKSDGPVDEVELDDG